LTEENKTSGKIEDKFKLSLLHIDKRFVDLELAIGELSEKLKDVDVKDVSEVKQRTDDIEDLIMVEQAGVLELKKMLEEIQKRAEAPQAPASVAVPKEEIEKMTSMIMGELHNKLEKTEKNVQSVINEISNLRTETGNEIIRIKERIGSSPIYADMQFITNRVKDLKNTVDSLLNMKVEVDSRILNLERSLVEISEKKGVSPNILKELENIKFKIDDLEKTTQETSTIIKFLDERKIEEKMKIISDIENTYSRLNQLYIGAQKNVQELAKVDLKIKDGMKIYEERLEKLENTLTEFKTLVQQQISSELNKKIIGIENRMGVVETFTKDFDKKISKTEIPVEMIDKQINELLSKIIFLETRLSALERMLQQPAKVEPIILE
jgi:hypothetical protein